MLSNLHILILMGVCLKTSNNNKSNKPVYAFNRVLGRKWRSSCSVWHLCPEITPISVHSNCNCSPLSHHHCSAGHCSRLPTVLSMLRFCSFLIYFITLKSEWTFCRTNIISPPAFKPFFQSLLFLTCKDRVSVGLDLYFHSYLQASLPLVHWKQPCCNSGFLLLHIQIWHLKASLHASNFMLIVSYHILQPPLLQLFLVNFSFTFRCQLKYVFFRKDFHVAPDKVNPLLIVWLF